MKIKNNKENKDCFLCSKKIESNKKIVMQTTLTTRRTTHLFKWDCHLSCAYKRLNNQTKKSKEDLDLIKELEAKYLKQILIENI